MPSTKLADCKIKLAERFFALRDEYHRDHAPNLLIVTCTHRSAEEQQKLFQVGRVFRGGQWVIDADPTTQIVTQIDGVTKKSRHNAVPAEALDVAVVVGGKVSWDPAQYAPLGPLAAKHGLVWGGDWPHFKDRPHLELP